MQRVVKVLRAVLEWVRRTRPLSVLVGVLLVVLAVRFMDRWIEVAIVRIRYPFDLEWMEGDVVTHVRLAREGASLYVAPSFDFTPLIYPPLYYYVSAVASWFVGVSYLAPRMVSLTSMLGSLWLIARWVRDETDDFVAGLVAAGALSATYGITGFWFDVARVDSLFVFLMVAALSLSPHVSNPRRAVLLGVLLAAAGLGKQTGLLFAAPALLPLVFRNLRLGAVAIASFGVALSGAIFLLERQSHGWFWFYYVTLPGRHAVAWNEAPSALEKFFWTPIVPLALSAAAVVCGVGLREGNYESWMRNGLFVLIATAASLASILHTGGYPNVLMPAYAAYSVCFGIEIAALRRLGPRYPGAPLLAGASVLLLSSLLDYDPARALPSRADRAAGERVMRRISGLRQPMWVTSSTYYAFRAGQTKTFSPSMGIIDVFKGGGKEAARLHDEFVDQIRSHRLKTIVLDRAAGFLPGDLVDFIKKNYHFKDRMFSPRDRAFWPQSGAEIRPDEIWTSEP